MIICKHIYKSITLGFFFLLFFNKIAVGQSPEFIIGSTINVTTSTITIPVTANKFTQILAWQGSINWNNSKLTYLNVNSIVSQLSGIQFNPSTISSKGMLSFFWVDNNLQSQSVSDSTVLFTLTFNVVANAAGSTDVSFSNDPTLLQLADLNGNQIASVNYINGNVSFANEVVPPEFTIGSIANVSSNSIIVPVTTKNFLQLLAIQGSISWDNTRLSFVSANSAALQLNNLQFNNSVNVNIGQLSFLWIDANLIPQTLADSAVLFTITFNVVGSTTGITNINFSNSPTLLQTSDALGIPINNTVYNNSIISFPGAVLPPIFILPTVSNVQTNSFTLPVTAKNFAQLKAIQGSITWDNRKYNYLNVSSSLTQLNGILFNAAVNGDYGTLSYVWVDANSAPQTLADNSILFTISFNRICGAVGENEIRFNSLPTSQLVINAGDSAVANVVYTNGRLSIPSSVSPAVYISTPSNILCSGISPVLSANISNGGTNQTLQWYKNNVLINGAINPTYTSSIFNNNDSIKCIISSNVACATTSIATSNIISFTQRPATKDTISISGCNAVLYNNIVYVSNATSIDTLRTVYGCDSVYRLVQVFIVPLTPMNQTINLSGCNSIIYNNINYTTSTIKIDTIRTSQGCDSIYNTVNIVIDKNILGNIKHLTKGNINNVVVKLSGSINNTLIASANYAFNCLPTATFGVIKLSKNNDINKANGINATDVLFTQRHILNTTKLNSAYKLIAADVNGDKLINATDVLRIKRLILGTDTTFTKGSGVTKVDRLWEFVDSAYVFPDTTNPFPFKDSISFSNLTSNKINQTFIGVKLGDVNYDWNAAVARQFTVNSLQLGYTISNEQLADSNSVINIPITVMNFKKLVAMQYTLHFDNTNYEFVGIENNKLNIDFNEKQAAINGNISMLWTDKNAVERSLEDGTEIFVLVLKQKGNGNLELGISDAITEIAAWDKDYNQHNIILAKREIITNNSPLTTSQWSVSPNPTSGEIKVSIVSKTNKTVSFELTDAQGKIILKQSVELQKGNNNFTINLKKNGNLTTGIYFLKAVGVEGDNVKRIIVK
jgi:hypothetical protein